MSQIPSLPPQAPYPVPAMRDLFDQGDVDGMFNLADANIRHIEAYLDSVAPLSCRLVGTTSSGGSVVWSSDQFWHGNGVSPFLDPAATTHLVVPRTGKWMFMAGIGFTVSGAAKLLANGVTVFGADDGADASPHGTRELNKNDVVELTFSPGVLAVRNSGPWLSAIRIGPIV